MLPLSTVGDGSAAIAAKVSWPTDVAVDAANALYIADSGNARVRRVSVGGTITTFAGGGASTADGVQATNALLNSPAGIMFDPAGNLFIVDQ